MAVIKKTLFPKNLEKFAVLVRDTEPDSKYFKITELPNTFTGGKNAFLIAGSENLVADTKIQIELKDSAGNVIYHEPGEGLISSSINGTAFVTEYFEGVSKVVAVYIYNDTAYGPCTLTILGEVSEYVDGNGITTPVPVDWVGKYNVKWQKQIDVNPSLPNTTKIRFYKRPTPTINEIVEPIYRIESGSKVATTINQSFADIKLSNLETFAGDVKRVKVFRTSEGTISDYDLIQDILVEAKELLTSFTLSGSVVGNTGIFTQETLTNYWNTGSLTAELTSSRVESGLKLNGNGNLRYSQSLDIKSSNTYEINFDAFYSSSTASNLGIYLSQVTTSGDGITPTIVSSSIGTLYGTQPTKNLLDTVIPFKLDRNYPSASLYFSQSQGEWYVGNVSLKLSQDTAFSPDEISFITTMPTVVGNETFNFKFEFYDVNNNYVPVAVTQSALFTGGTTGSAVDVDFIISSSISQSLSQSLDALYQVSSSISGTVTFNSSSISGSLGFVSSSVSGTIGSVSSSISGTIGSVSGSISQSVALTLSSSLSKVKLLADGGYPGTFIESSSIYSPVIAGQLGYFSTLFKVGQSPNSIYLDARQTPRKIFIGGSVPVGDTEYSGAFNNSNTNVYLDSAGKFSLGDKLNWDGSTLSVNGTITATGGTIGGVVIASNKMYVGTGTYNNSNTTFYVDNTGQFSLKDKLTWNGTSLSVNGSITVTGGNAATTTDVSTAAGNAALSASVVDGKVFTDSSGKLTKTPSASSSGLYLGSTYLGYYNGSTWKTYMSDSGNFYLSGNGTNSLTWNGSSLSINGSLTTSDATIGGWSIDSSRIYSTNGITLDSANKQITVFDSSGAGRIYINQNASLSSLSAGSAQLGYGAASNDTGTISEGTYSKTSLNSVILTSGKTWNLKAVFTEANGTNGVTISSGQGTPYAIDIWERVYIRKTTSPNTEYLIAEYKDGVSFGTSVSLAAINNKQNSITIAGDGGTYEIITRVTWQAQGTYNGGVYTASTLRFSPFDFTASPANSFVEIIAGGLQVGRDANNYVKMDRAATSGVMLEVGGEGSFTGDVTANTSSDIRLKEDIVKIPNAMDKVLKISGNTFKWKKGFEKIHSKKGSDIGVIAQEVESILPDIVVTRHNGYKGVQYEKLVALLIEAIKELKSEIEELKNNK